MTASRNEVQVKQQELANLTGQLAQALPASSGYEKGYRDALESIALALAPTLTAAALTEAVTTALDAYGNNATDNAAEESVATPLSAEQAKRVSDAVRVLTQSLSGIVSADQLAVVATLLSTPESEQSHLVVQEGGSSSEFYVHEFDTEADAQNHRIECEVGCSYRTGEIVSVPRWLAQAPGFCDLAEQLIQSSACVEYPGVPEGWEQSAATRSRSTPA